MAASRWVATSAPQACCCWAAGTVRWGWGEISTHPLMACYFCLFSLSHSVMCFSVFVPPLGLCQEGKVGGLGAGTGDLGGCRATGAG